MRIAAALAFGLVLAGHAPALAQSPAPEPVPVAEWPLSKISAMGAAIYRQDVAAWVSTDALLAHLAGAPPPEGMAGWIVVDEGEDQRVRYIRRDGVTLRAAFDVVVRDGRAGAVELVDAELSESERSRFVARQTAIENIGRLRCSQRLNTVVLDDPDSDNWLVWLLTSTNDADVVPMGGHYRFTISADGTTVLQRDQLSNGCLPMEKPDPSPDRQTAALVVSQIVSQTPVETHVFLSLQNRMPIYVMAGDRLYEVEGARIREVPR